MWERPPCDYVKINYDGSRRQNMSTGGWIFRDAQGFFLEFKWIPREDNKATDHLAKQFHNSQVSFNSIFYVPVSITQILHEDISSSL
uniref:RNase H type-1 domain-containing protein n=1 Tax=Brassica oleracea TaxID=3712 RepID=A0A3P6FWA4_BRAOL|nr:unnamed protein product [Brassica oleracea]